MRFNTLPAAAAEQALMACCASRRWARTVTEGRPYATAGDLLAAAGTALRELAWPDVEEALRAHPRIGAPRGARSRGEQSGVTDADRTAFAAANADYERRFGHVFLIRAAGRDGAEMLAELNRRLANPAEAERAIVRRELVEITELRVRRLVR